MLPSSHKSLMEARYASVEGTLLAGAISEFMAASSRLELSYRDLQSEVAELKQALRERNQDLSHSLHENKLIADRLQLVLETIPCGVLVLSKDGWIESANREAARLLTLTSGHEPQECGSVAADESHFGLRTSIESLADDSEQEISFETSGQRIWLAVRRRRLPGQADATQGGAESVVTLRDVTDRKLMEEERETTRSAVALAELSALLAHEIRNPLASLELFSGLMSDLPERNEEWLAHLTAGIRCLSGTVNNVLALQGNSSPFWEDVDVLTEIRSLLNFLTPVAEQAQVDLEFSPGFTGEAMHLHVRANRSAFHQILMNLCVNSFRHTPAGGRVWINCQRPQVDAGSVRIQVIDNGSGIAPEHLSHILEIGFSGSGSTSGLGLAVCDRLLRQLNGALYVESCLGRGSTFTVELPQA